MLQKKCNLNEKKIQAVSEKKEKRDWHFFICVVSKQDVEGEKYLGVICPEEVLIRHFSELGSIPGRIERQSSLSAPPAQKHYHLCPLNGSGVITHPCLVSVRMHGVDPRNSYCSIPAWIRLKPSLLKSWHHNGQTGSSTLVPKILLKFGNGLVRKRAKLSLKAVTHQMRCDAPSVFPTTKQQMRHNTASLCAHQECVTMQFHNIIRHIALLWSLPHDAQKLKCFNLQKNDFKFTSQRDRCVIALIGDQTHRIQDTPNPGFMQSI